MPRGLKKQLSLNLIKERLDQGWLERRTKQKEKNRKKSETAKEWKKADALLTELDKKERFINRYKQ